MDGAGSDAGCGVSHTLAGKQQEASACRDRVVGPSSVGSHLSVTCGTAQDEICASASAVL